MSQNAVTTKFRDFAHLETFSRNFLEESLFGGRNPAKRKKLHANEESGLKTQEGAQAEMSYQGDQEQIRRFPTDGANSG